MLCGTGEGEHMLRITGVRREDSGQEQRLATQDWNATIGNSRAHAKKLLSPEVRAWSVDHAWECSPPPT